MSTAIAIAPPNFTAIGVILLVVVAASCDIVARRIPNRLILASLLAALAVQAASHGPSLHGVLTGAAQWACGAVPGLLILLPFYLVRGMAAGDVKLMMAVGAWVGLPQVAVIALATFVLGGIWAVAVVLARRRMGQLMMNLMALLSGGMTLRGAGDMDKSSSGTGGTGGCAVGVAVGGSGSLGTMPYGVAIALGTIGVMFAQR